MVAIVGIGTSAGGLKALESFFQAVTDANNLCFVVIQHLSPGYRSLMDELLGRKSNLTIRKIADGDKVTPNTIFLNSPTQHVDIIGDTFHLRAYDETDTVPRLPINHFFTSLSKVTKFRTVGVVLSGTLSDGAQGCVELARAGSPIFIQSPEEAEFDAMPKAVHAVCPQAESGNANELPVLIAERLRDHQPQTIDEPRTVSYKRIIRLLERQHGLDFRFYKDKTILRRIARRGELRGFAVEDDYLELLERDPDALAELYSDLLIGVTAFYRDPECFALLRELVYPTLIEKVRANNDVRIWVPACGTGEEAYSIAIDLTEAMIAAGVSANFRIIATDVFNPAIRFASQGTYSQQQVEKVPPKLLEKYFTRSGEVYTIKSMIRQSIIFSTHNAINDPPFMNLDFVSCRNMMIYLDNDGQEQLISRFLFGLNQYGFLLIGPSETLGRQAQDFNELSAKWRIYRKISGRKMGGRTLFQSRPRITDSYGDDVDYANRTMLDRGKAARPPALAAGPNMNSSRSASDQRSKLIAIYDSLLKRYAPSSIVVDLAGNVLTWFGQASTYIDTKSNLADWRVEDIVHVDLQYFINIGIERVKNSEFDAFARRIKVNMGQDKVHLLNVSIEPLGATPHGERSILVQISHGSEVEDEKSAPIATTESDDKTEKALLSARIRELEKDLRLTEESLQYVTEGLETNAEELQASNEELQASNEELQASNEELQASNEELQAVNEELLSVSAEHERKIEIISEAERDHEVAMSLLSAASVFLDSEMCILRFSKGAGELLGLKSHDEGRPIRLVGEKMPFADLDEMAKAANETKQVQIASGDFKGATHTVIVKSVPAINNLQDFHTAILFQRNTNVD